MNYVFYEPETGIIRSIHQNSGQPPEPPAGQLSLVTEENVDGELHTIVNGEIVPREVPVYERPARATRLQVDVYLDSIGIEDGLENPAVKSYVASQTREFQIRFRNHAIWSSDDPGLQAAAAALGIQDLRVALTEASKL